MALISHLSEGCCWECYWIVLDGVLFWGYLDGGGGGGDWGESVWGVCEGGGNVGRDGRRIKGSKNGRIKARGKGWKIDIKGG